MTAPILADALGPRGRRQAKIASIVAVVVIVALVVVAVGRLNEKGQFDAALWRPLVQWGVVRFLLIGLVNTLKVSAVAMAGALVFGALLALGRLSRRWPMRLVASAYIEFFRGIPLYLLILFCGFGLPQLGLDVTLFTALALGLTLYNSAILAEIYRAGILLARQGPVGGRLWPGDDVLAVHAPGDGAAGDPAHGAGHREPARHVDQGLVAGRRHRL